MAQDGSRHHLLADLDQPADADRRIDPILSPNPAGAEAERGQSHPPRVNFLDPAGMETLSQAVRKAARAWGSLPRIVHLAHIAALGGDDFPGIWPGPPPDLRAVSSFERASAGVRATPAKRSI